MNWTPEVTMAHPTLLYAGRTDQLSPNFGVPDIKTRKRSFFFNSRTGKRISQPKPYYEEMMQPVAYCEGLRASIMPALPRKAAFIFVSREAPIESDLYVLSDEEYEEAWENFKDLNRYFQRSRGLEIGREP